MSGCRRHGIRISPLARGHFLCLPRVPAAPGTGRFVLESLFAQHFAPPAHCLLREAMNTKPCGLKRTVRARLGTVGTEQSGVPRSNRDLLDRMWPELASELSRLARALGLSTEQADDAVQDVYVQALRKCPAGLSRLELRKWLFRVATNRCRLEHRRKRRWLSVVGVLTRAWQSDNHRAEELRYAEAEESAGANERRRVVQAGLDALDADLRAVLVLRYFGGFNSREIARMLDMPDSTVRSRLRQARLKLARQLEGTGYDEP